MTIIDFLKRVKRRLGAMVKNDYLAGGLTRVPSSAKSTISDLFIWRKETGWRTFFELLDINSLIDADHNTAVDEYALFIFYNSKGDEIAREKIVTNQTGRQTIDINSLIPEGSGNWGTYACFHENIPPKIAASGSFIAERGYSGYEWKELGARGYVHGNLDAISKSGDSTELLGNSGRRNFLYQVQHEMTGPAVYEFALVNPTCKKQKVEFSTTDSFSGKNSSEHFSLLPRASCIKKVTVSNGSIFRLTIKSKMYMARPVVFRLAETSMDVFHG